MQNPKSSATENYVLGLWHGKSETSIFIGLHHNQTSNYIQLGRVYLKRTRHDIKAFTTYFTQLHYVLVLNYFLFHSNKNPPPLIYK